MCSDVIVLSMHFNVQENETCIYSIKMPLFDKIGNLNSESIFFKRQNKSVLFSKENIFTHVFIYFYLL